MKKRSIIVNRQFQFNIAAKFAFITAVSMTVIIVILSTVLIYNNRKLEKINRDQQVHMETSNEIFKSLIALSKARKLETMHLSSSALQKDSYSTMVLIKQNVDEIKKITARNRLLILILVFSAIIQSIIVFYYMLKRSHRISGPIFLLNRYIDELIDGNKPEIRPLRHNDDFHDLFDKFRVLADMIPGKNTGKKKSK